ncbi:MAG: septum formation initiator family protein [bacterium]
MPEKKPLRIRVPRGRELRTRLIMTVGIAVSIYMAVSTIQTLWQNYRLDQELLKLREQNAELKLHNQYLQNLIAYRKTDSFRDKEARSKLNYQKPGETVLIIPEENTDRFTQGNITDQTKTSALKREPANPEKWWNFIFGKPEE